MSYICCVFTELPKSKMLAGKKNVEPLGKMFISKWEVGPLWCVLRHHFGKGITKPLSTGISDKMRFANPVTKLLPSA